MKTLLRSTLFLLLALAASSAGSVRPIEGLRIEAKSLGISFEAPEKWRLSRESTPEQLLLYPGKTKDTPVLRIRRFDGDLKAEERMAEMTRGLPEAESNAHIVSSETWSHERMRLETAVVGYKKGSQEWFGYFTLVAQPRRSQHAFWIYGRKRDVQRHWDDIKASILTTKSLGASKEEEPSAKSPSAPPAKDVKAVWADKKSGLQVSSWPAGFNPEPKSLDRFPKEELVLSPIDDKAHKSTNFRITCDLEAKAKTTSTAAAELHAALGAKSTVRDLRRLPVQVGGQDAVLIKWVEEKGETAMAHQVHFVQKGESAFRIDYVAEEGWSRARSRRSLLKDFIGGLSFD